MGELVEDPLFGEMALQEIVGKQLSAVTFVMDYVQLAFDGPMINAYAWPTVHVGDRKFDRSDPSYRDELCARVAISVVAVQVPREAIEIAFADGSTIRISLRAEDLHEGIPEAAEFNGCHLVTFGPDD
jgi:hypothetical protein